MFRLVLSRKLPFRTEAGRLVAPRVPRLLGDYVASSCHTAPFSTAAAKLPPVLPPPSPPQPQTPVAEKGLAGKVINRYSIKGQQHRIRVAESFFQAATRQASNQ